MFYKIISEIDGIIIPDVTPIIADALYNNEGLDKVIQFFIAIIICILISYGVYKILKKIVIFIFENIKEKLLNKHDEYNRDVD